jgi:hypothetical protein
MMDELVSGLQALGRLGSQVPQNAKFDIKYPNAPHITLAKL